MKIVYPSACITFIAAVSLNGQTSATAYSPPLGGIEFSAEALQETPVGIPFHRSAVAIANLVEVAAPVTDSENNFVSLRLFLDRPIGAAGDYNPDPDTGLPSYYLEVATGTASGERFPIAGSGEDWVIIDQEPQEVLAASFDPNEPRDRVRIRPCWTPNTFMPAAEAPLSATSDDSANQIEMRSGDAILLPGRESSAQHVLHRFNDSENESYWAEWDGDNAYLIAGDYGIMPGKTSWIRRANESDARWPITGDVTMFDQTWPIPTPSSGEIVQWPFSLTEAKVTTLDASGLKSALRASASAAERSDELLVWENLTGFHARPAKRFYLQAASPDPIWREVGDKLTDQGAYLLEPGKAYTIYRRGE